MFHLFAIRDEKLSAALARRGRAYVLLHDGREYPVALRQLPDGAAEIEVAGNVARVVIAREGDDTFVRLGGESYAVRWIDPLDRLAHAGGASLDDVALAPMPGTVVAVQIKPGERVTRGQTMMVIESMKLETAIVAWRDGVIETLHVSAGQTFERAAPLVTLAASREE
ncbi:MAG TPA: biotin/lipoyl-containing protein [Candidatus Binataceae bacterium]|nr:biotin/lipoyl-containing protein [Candidatus Binataceae bacterium]